MPPFHAIVVGGGAGTRLGLGDKAFLTIGGRTLIEHCLERLLGIGGLAGTVVVVPPGRVEVARSLIGEAPEVMVAAGGATRRESVACGLAALAGAPASALIAVHDAARPLASAGLWRRVVAAADRYGAAIPCLPVRDAVKAVEGGMVVGSLDRNRLGLAQTPQAFRAGILRQAHERAAQLGLDSADDSELVRGLDLPVAVVAGELANLKLTDRADLDLVVRLLRGRIGDE